MEMNGHSFLDKVLGIVKDERAEDVPLIIFRHPKNLEAQAYVVTCPVREAEDRAGDHWDSPMIACSVFCFTQRKKILSQDLDISLGVSDSELERCVRHLLKYSVKTDQAVFRNQLYGGTDPYGLAGAWLAEAFNTSQYTYEVAPVFTLIEMKILNHILKLFGIPEGDGIFSPGGSLSMLYGLVAARYKAFPQVKSKGMRGLPELVVFTSEDSHYSICKAAHWLGFGTDSIRFIKTNNQGQMITSELDKVIEEEKRLGRCPLMVNATAGTTVLGAIDNLEEVADVCQKHGVVMYVDACWGGSLMLSPQFKHRLKGIERADFISWNPHKMAGAPLQCSVFMTRHRGLLHVANCAAANYLFQQDKFYDVSYDTGDKSIQCGRKIDAFKLWMIWKARGDHGLAALLDRTMEVAEFCIETIAARPGFRLVSAPIQCPNVCFWYIPKFMRDEQQDEKWWEMMHKVTPKIKELLTLNSQLMVAYSPLRHHKNFFRLAFSFHPIIEERTVVEMLQSIEDCGEQITRDMLY